MSDRYCVFGNPVGHSKSPLIHAAFAAQCGQDLSYEALLVPLDGFAASVRAFVAADGHGANVTVPFKEEAFHLADRLTVRAELAAAVNTLRFDGAEILGDNTDGAGLDVILIDDLRIYETGEWEDGPLPEGTPGEPTENGADWIRYLFSETHNAYTIVRDQGYLLLLPKG